MPHVFAVEPPTENQGANAMADKISQESHGLLRLMTFKKTNGQRRSFGGIEMYTMECFVEIVAIQDCAMTGFVMGSWSGSFEAVMPQKSSSELGKFNPLKGSYAGYKQVPNGTTMRFTTQINFDLTERGWRTEGKLPTDTPFGPSVPTNPPEPKPSVSPEVANPEGPSQKQEKENNSSPLSPPTGKAGEYNAEGTYYSDKWDFGRAIESLTEAIRIAPNKWEIYCNRANARC